MTTQLKLRKRKSARKKQTNKQTKNRTASFVWESRVVNSLPLRNHLQLQSANEKGTGLLYARVQLYSHELAEKKN
jgi:hypothetical protein